jgi:hypothetical protein
MHLRAPSIDRGVQAFIWSVVFFLVIFLGGKAIGVSGGTSFILGLVAGFLIFVLVRTRGARTTTGEL